MENIIVIKFGGEIVEFPDKLSNLATSVNKLYQEGVNIVLVHGGGPLATKLSEKLNIRPNMVGGRRITCIDTLEVMKMTLPGVVNSNVLSILRKFNIPAAGASGISFVKAITRPPRAVSGSDGKVIDWGYVGDIKDIDPGLLLTLLEKKFVTVVSPLSSDDDGKILNINADTVAVQIAKVLNAKKLVLITNIGGVYEDINDPKSRFSTLTMEQAKQKIESGIIQGGMIPKLEEGFKLLAQHLNSFHIVGVDTPECLQDEILNPGSKGTAIIK